MTEKNITLFSNQIDMIEGGSLDRDMGSAVKEVLQAVTSVRAAGTITMTLKIKPEGVDQVMVESKIVAKPPVLPRGKSIMWVDKDFSLIDVDPTQMALELANQADVSRSPAVVIDNTKESTNG